VTGQDGGAVQTGPGFEWFVAWRHLRRVPGRRSRWVLKIGLVLLVLGAALFVLAWWFGQRSSIGALGPFRARPPVYVQYAWWAGVIGGGLGTILTFLGVLLELFTVFAAGSIAGVFLGTMAPIVALSVMSGFETDLKGKIRGSKADVVITRAEDKPFTSWRETLAALAGIPGLAASAPYIEGEVMLRAGGTPAGVIVRGIDPSTAAAVLDIKRTLKEGDLDDLLHPERVKDALDLPFGSAMTDDTEEDDKEAGDDKPARGDRAGAGPRAERLRRPAREPGPPKPTIILGEELYGKNLRVFIGSDMDVVCPLCGTGPTGARPKSKSFRVAGHFYSGMYEFDSKLAYIGLEEAQRFFEMPGEITGIDVRARDPDRAGELASAIQRRIGPLYDVRSWQELNQELFRALRLEKIAMFIVLTFIALVASFSIASLLIMMTTQKGGEVAILKAMGATDGAVLRVFFAEGLYIGLIGVILGLLAGVRICRFLKTLSLPTDVYYINQLPVMMRASEILTVAAIALLLCCLATVYPALRASNLRPVEGLRYE
jgi:lipoprotein-releasing system permease protein